MNKKIHSLSNSGGRTSAYMAWLFHNNQTGLNDGLPHEKVFNDTTAEDPSTYKFLNKCDEIFGFNTICLESVVDPQKGKGNGFIIKPLSSCKFDMRAMAAHVKKYGNFTINRPNCTDRLKTVIAKKYRDETHGKGQYYIWLGIRFDEPKRLVGDNNDYRKSAYKQLMDQGLNDYEISILFRRICKNVSVLDSTYVYLASETKNLLIARREQQESLGLRYLAEISDFEKQDILNWWKKQPFDLEISEHRGNCLFCIKKSAIKVALAARDCPDEFKLWNDTLTGPDVRLMPADKRGTGHIYRKWQSPMELIGMFKDVSTEELRERIYRSRMDESGSCSESCEAHGDL